MGMIIPNVAADPSDQTDFGSNIAVLGGGGETPAAGPDASLLNRSDFPSKELPPIIGVRDARYQTVFCQSVLDDIHAHGKSSPEAEVCGVLIGDVYSDRLSPWAYVEHSIRGNNAVGKQTQVTITSETWSRIHETLESKYPGKKIIGWYHTHPGFGIFLSGMDLFIQDNFFNQPWQLATVYDPHSGDEGTFIWRGGKSIRENILVENDLGLSALPGGSMDAIEKLNRRVKHLERRLDFILTGFLFLVLLALVAPLVVFALAPDTVKKLPHLHRGAGTPATVPGQTPAATQPAAADISVHGGDGKSIPAATLPRAAGTPPPARDAILLNPDPTDEEVNFGPGARGPKKAGTH